MAEIEEPEVVVIDEESAKVFHWRVRRFMGLGFTLWQARSLARVGADWHAAKKLLDAGCPVATAFDVLS